MKYGKLRRAGLRADILTRKLGRHRRALVAQSLHKILTPKALGRGLVFAPKEGNKPSKGLMTRRCRVRMMPA
jgi:hypothetical protein